MVNPNRQIVLDTETTGMNQLGAHYEGHCIIEIGAVEMIIVVILAIIFTFILSLIVLLILKQLKFMALQMKCWQINPHLMRLHSHFWIILNAQNY